MNKRTQLSRWIDTQLSRIVAPIERRRRGAGQKLNENDRSKTHATLAFCVRETRIS